jgi:hypothetical protein
VTDLNSRATAQAVVDAATRAADKQIARRLPSTRYGVVFGQPDVDTRTVSVRLMGQPEPSGGFVYGTIEPADGDRVRVVIDPRGDRYVDDVLGRDGGPGILPVVIALPPPEARLRGRLYLLAGGVAVADVLYLCVKNNLDAYVWVAV